MKLYWTISIFLTDLNRLDWEIQTKDRNRQWTISFSLSNRTLKAHFQRIVRKTLLSRIRRILFIDFSFRFKQNVLLRYLTRSICICMKQNNRSHPRLRFENPILSSSVWNHKQEDKQWSVDTHFRPYDRRRTSLATRWIDVIQGPIGIKDYLSEAKWQKLLE